MNIFNRKNRSKQLHKNKQDSEAKLHAYAFLPVEELFTRLSDKPEGLTSEEANIRQDKYGTNVITVGKKVTLLHKLREAVVNPFNVILLLSTLIVAGVALLTGFSDFAVGLDMQRLPLQFIPWLAAIVAGYLLCVQAVKKVYVGRYKEWM